MGHTLIPFDSNLMIRAHCKITLKFLIFFYKKKGQMKLAISLFGQVHLAAKGAASPKSGGHEFRSSHPLSWIKS